MNCQATYSPDDNKLRLRFTERLEPDLYKRVHVAGYIWAPKQQLFVAPMWTPEREDLALELAGAIEDEDTSLLERAEERSERFEEYAEKRAADADQAREAVSRIADGIPLGQPILIGHHSEKHARKDAERIENGMRRAIKAFETSAYWERRAKGAISHAKYKELPDVRVRRISGLEADERKHAKDRANAEKFLAAWGRLNDAGFLKNKYTGEASTPQEKAACLANYDSRAGLSATDIREGKLTPEAAQAEATAKHAVTLAICNRWLSHLANRLTYERAMLADSGFVPPPKPERKLLPLLNYAGPVTYQDPYSRGQCVTEEATPVTKAELAALPADMKGSRVSSCGTHRVRYACLRRPGEPRGGRIVFVTDSKQHPRPTSGAVAAGEAQVEADRRGRAAKRTDDAQAQALASEERHAAKVAKAAPFEAIKASLKAGVQVVAAPYLFETPRPLAARMVELAQIEPQHTVLEPNAGTGRLLEALRNGVRPHGIFAVESNPRLVELLHTKFYEYARVLAQDFLTLAPGSPFPGYFDRVLMNPPFDHGIDIDHVKHALTFLKPGGRLVGICAGGSKQEKELRPLSDSWEKLPPGTFAEAGTNVATVLFTITKD